MQPPLIAQGCAADLPRETPSLSEAMWLQQAKFFAQTMGRGATFATFFLFLTTDFIFFSACERAKFNKSD